MTRHLQSGSKYIRLDKDNSTDPTTNELVTERKAYIIVDKKHKPVFHRDGHLLIFYSKRTAKYYLDTNEVPEEWRVMKISLEITKH